MAKIADIEGIGPKFAKKLQSVGVRSTGRLLQIGTDKRGRMDLAQET